MIRKGADNADRAALHQRGTATIRGLLHKRVWKRYRQYSTPQLAPYGDQCGDYMITGKLGHIYADDLGLLLYVTAPGSPRRWTLVKRRLAFCSLTQDGEDEGCLYLDRLPEPAEAKPIREALGIRKRRRLSPEQPYARMPLKPIQNHDKTAPGGPAFAQSVEEHQRAQYFEGLVLGHNTPFFRNAAVR